MLFIGDVVDIKLRISIAETLAAAQASHAPLTPRGGAAFRLLALYRRLREPAREDLPRPFRGREPPPERLRLRGRTPPDPSAEAVPAVPLPMSRRSIGAICCMVAMIF